ncbi:MAG: acetyl-CoA carboxylase biotin carboxyl carrier protein [Flavobacteriales bacterium]
MNLTEIQDLIKFVSKSGVSEVEIEQKEFKITIKSDGPKKRGRAAQQQIEAQMMPQMAVMQHAQVPQQMAPPAPVPAPAAAAPTTAAPAEENSKYIEIKSPMIGTFYRSASPDKPAFVEVGDQIKEGSTVCIVEAMKLFNEIEAEFSGKIVKVLVDDNTPVEFDQPLFLVDPS